MESLAPFLERVVDQRPEIAESCLFSSLARAVPGEDQKSKPGIWLELTQHDLAALGALRFIAIRVTHKDTTHRESVLERLSSSLGPVRKVSSPEFSSKCLSVCYECAVYLRFVDAGLRVSFIPESNSATKSPDLELNGAYLVECKDSQSGSGYTGRIESITSWMQDQIQIARSQMEQYDSEHKFCHIVCLDLPENAMELVSSLSKAEFESFTRDCYFSPAQDSGVIPEPLGVLFSSIDFGLHANPPEGGKINLGFEQWWHPLVLTYCDVRVAGLLNDLFHSLGTTPFAHTLNATGVSARKVKALGD